MQALFRKIFKTFHFYIYSKHFFNLIQKKNQKNVRYLT